MSSRMRFLLVIAVVIVILGVGAALVLPGFLNNNAAGTAGTGGTGVAQQPAGQPTEVPATPTPAATPIPTVSVVIAVQQVNRGQLISPDLITVVDFPSIYVPQSAIGNIEDVIGKIARVDIFREQPVLRSMITENLSELGAVGSDAGALLPQGRRMIAVPIDRLTSAGYALAPGDRVDVITSFLFVDLDQEFQTRLPNGFGLVSVTLDELGSRTITIPPTSITGRIENRSYPAPIGSWATIIGTNETQRPRLATQMTIQDALVMYVGTFPPGGRIFGEPTPLPAPTEAPAEGAAPPSGQATALPPPTPTAPDIIALAVSPQEAVVMTYFIESRIPITFALRPANEIGLSNTAAVTLDYIMSQYRISLPRRVEYGLEPAIRSIRQIITGDTISLQD